MSNQFLTEIIKHQCDVICPTIVLTETAAATSRADGSPALAQSARQMLTVFPKIQFLSVDMALAELAAQMAETHRLRAADSIYLAVAVQEGTTLITWDDEMQKRGLSAVTVLTPTEWLAQLPATP